MKVIIYVLPHEIEAMNKWLNHDENHSLKKEAPSYWIEPLRDVDKRQSLVQVIISPDDFQKLLDEKPTSGFISFAKTISDFENPKQTKLKI